GAPRVEPLGPGSVENFDSGAVARQSWQRLERTANRAALPEPSGPGMNRHSRTDNANLDIIDSIAEQIVDLALETSLQGCLDGGVRTGLDDDCRTLVVPTTGQWRRKKPPQQTRRSARTGSRLSPLNCWNRVHGWRRRGSSGYWDWRRPGSRFKR